MTLCIALDCIFVMFCIVVSFFRLFLFSSRLMGTNMHQKAPLPEQTPPRQGVV
jgi:hypothetical protein